MVAPKKLRLAEAEESLAQTMTLLNAKRQELAEVEAKLANLKAQFQETTEKKEQLEYQVIYIQFYKCVVRTAKFEKNCLLIVLTPGVSRQNFDLTNNFDASDAYVSHRGDEG